MAIESPRELFMRDLRVILDAEFLFSRAYETMRRDTGDRQLKKAISNHLRETEQQILNLTMVFDYLNEDASRVPCEGARGICNEYLEGVRELEGPPQLGAKFVIAVLLKGESYEITAYEELIGQAELLGQSQVAQLLRQNHEQEVAMRRALEQLVARVSRELARRT